MITQLLRITTQPIKYEMEIERARLELDQDFMPKPNISTEKPKVETRTRNAQVQLNTYEARKSLGYPNANDMYKIQADKGKESISQTTRNYVEIGNSMSRIDAGVTIAQIFAEKVLGEQPVLYMAFLPSTGADISWIPYEADTTYSPGGVSYDWQIMRNVMNYVPGSVRMTILQQPKVDIEYIGGPVYIPPSADPEYVSEN